MILVNLLPHHLRPIKRTPLPHILSVAVLVLAVFVMVSMYVTQATRIASAQSEKIRLETDLAALSEVVEETERLAAQKARLQTKVDTIQEIVADRIIWSEHLHRLTELTPENIWYSRIHVTNERFQEIHPVLDDQGRQRINPRTNQPERERRTVYRRVLRVSGYAIRDEDGLPSTTRFASETSTDDKFAAMFQMRTTHVQDTEFEGYPVRHFTFDYLIDHQEAG